MQEHFPFLTPTNQATIAVVTQLLHVEAEGSQRFLPWDILDDLHEFIQIVSYLTFDDGCEIEIPYDDLKEQATFIQETTTRGPFHLAIKIATENDESIGRKIATEIGRMFLANTALLTSFDTSGLTSVTSIGSWFLYNCHSLTALN
eukprot:PhF_6_TR34222/c0_g3_i2/m.50216